MRTPLVGITLQPELKYLDLLEPLFRDEADYFEIAPETMWRIDRAGTWVHNGFRRAFAEHDVFRFRWFTDHLGASVLAGRAVTLPIALPMDEAMAAIVSRRLLELQAVVPDVGFENSVFYFLLGPWLEEPAFFARILEPPRTHLLLDLHNVHTMAVNLHGDADEYLDRIDASRVIEIHLAGGSASGQGWLPEGRTMWLDAHDHAVPEPVWRLYERVVPRCSNLRGVTLERMEGTVEADDVDGLRDELRRARGVLRAGR